MWTRYDPSTEARQFRRDYAASLVANAFPNPKREGCPGSETLRNLASRPGPLRKTGTLIEHVMLCSPCYRELARYRRRRVFVPAAAAAAAVAILSAGAWFLSSR